LPMFLDKQNAASIKALIATTEAVWNRTVESCSDPTCLNLPELPVAAQKYQSSYLRCEVPITVVFWVVTCSRFLSEMLVTIYKTTWCHNPEDNSQQSNYLIVKPCNMLSKSIFFFTEMVAVIWKKWKHFNLFVDICRQYS
jgi:hypothetical protein